MFAWSTYTVGTDLTQNFELNLEVDQYTAIYGNNFIHYELAHDTQREKDRERENGKKRERKKEGQKETERKRNEKEESEIHIDIYCLKYIRWGKSAEYRRQRGHNSNLV